MTSRGQGVLRCSTDELSTESKAGYGIAVPCGLLTIISVLRSVPTDSDNNPKLVHVSYDQAKAKDAPDGGAAGGGAAGGKLITEKTDQVMGSCAGAG